MKFLALTLFAFLSFSSMAQVEGSPFTDVQFDSFPSVKVEVEGEVYYLLAVNGVRRQEIFDSCLQKLGSEETCQDMFAEEFVDLMTALNMPVESSVELRLYTMRNHSISTVEADVTLENLNLVIQNREFRGE